LAFILKCEPTYTEFPSISDADVFPEIGFKKLMVLNSDPSKKNEMLSIIENYVRSDLEKL
jgi:hypothetical protein